MRKLQSEIIEMLRVSPVIDVDKEIRRRIDFLKSYLLAHPFLKGYVLGISGGQDSTLAGKLAQMAIDELNFNEHKYEFVAMRLPYGVQIDESDCQDALRYINPNIITKVDIKPSVDASVKSVSTSLGVEVSDFNKGNVKARHRMEVQYQVAGTMSLAVLGTDHAAEAVTGFYTKFGDGGADLMPLFGLTKRQGKMILQVLDCPDHLYLKIPTADLEDDLPQLADEIALGVSYEEIDDYLQGFAVNEEACKKIESWFLRSKHKRVLPITVYDDWWK